jgi:hypothetical protein
MTDQLVTAAWSVKDIISHVTWWEEEALKYLPLIHAGGKSPKYSDMYGGIDAFNEIMSREKKGLTLGEAFREQEETHRRLVELVRATPEEEFTRETRFRRRLRFDTYRHYGEHAASILRWRARRGGQENTRA